ncbi:MAG: NADH-quinone oxidoreductase subunit L [Limisphaerales bacterium]
MNPSLNLWLIPILPLAGFVINGIFGKKSSRQTVSVVGLFFSGAAFAWALWVALRFSSLSLPYQEYLAHWIRSGSFTVDFAFYLDQLSLVMLLVVTGVGFLIHIYSVGYMWEDPSYYRFFAYLNLFMFFMLTLVLANNYLLMFIGWEGVGLASYLLIGFWFTKDSAASAGKKAFIVNRIGDFGFLIALFLLIKHFGTLNFTQVFDAVKPLSAETAGVGLLTTIGILLMVGAAGKSAQIPLYVWLPDAMEGPTPVSALIHAATMVAAGVYMLCRIIFLLDATALLVIAYIGGFTALLAALIAVQQNDIKRILAYSTLSQLGYMVMAVGLNGPTPAMFHLTTHAFFKALLFLGAGSVIHALHEEQDIWKMGGLCKKMGITFWTFLIGTLALSGVPPFSGFYSKDSILAQALEQKSYPLFVLGAAVAGLTTFYMFRLFYVAFVGKHRTEAASHAHESPAVMTWPLIVLALFAIIGGFIPISEIYASQFTGRGSGLSLVQRILEPLHSPVPLFAGLAAVAIGWLIARALYQNAATDPLPARLGRFATAMKNRFYFDEFYEATFIRAHDFIAAVMDFIDRWVVDWGGIGLVRGGTDFSGRALRLLQTGNLQTYAFLFALGVAVVLYWVLK